MITTIDRYKWLRIEGESFKVPAGDFMGIPYFVDPTMPPGRLEIRDQYERVLASADFANDAGEKHG